MAMESLFGHQAASTLVIMQKTKSLAMVRCFGQMAASIEDIGEMVAKMESA